MIEDVTKMVLDKFRDSDKKYEPVDICHFFMMYKSIHKKIIKFSSIELIIKK